MRDELVWVDGNAFAREAELGRGLRKNPGMFRLPSILFPPSKTQGQKPHPLKTRNDAAPEFKFPKNLCSARHHGFTGVKLK